MMRRRAGLVQGDFPDIGRFRDKMSTYDDYRKDFRSLRPQLLHARFDAGCGKVCQLRTFLATGLLQS